MIEPVKILRELKDRSLLPYQEVFPYNQVATPYDNSTVFNDTNNNLSEDNGTLIFAGGTGVYGETAVWGKSASVGTQGLALGVSGIVRTSGTLKIGLDTNQAGDIGSTALVNNSDNLTLADGGAVIGEMAAGVMYHYTFVMNDSGGVYICVRGGGYLDWTLLLPLHALTGTPSTVYPCVTNNDAAATVDALLNAQFLNTWDTADDLVQLTPGTAEGTTFSHHYNCIVSWVQSSLDDATTDMELRKRSGSDASVRFRVESDGTARIIEHDGSSPTTLASSSAGAVSLNDRVYAIVHGKDAYFVIGDAGASGINATLTGYTEFEETGSVLSYSGGTVSFSSIKVYDARITDRLAAQLEALQNETLTRAELLNLYDTNGFTYFVRDQFTTDDAADLTTPRTAEPTGTWDVVQTDSPFSISSAALQLDLSTQATNLGTNYLLSQDEFTLAAGLCAKVDYTQTSTLAKTLVGFVETDNNLRVTGGFYSRNADICMSASVGVTTEIVIVLDSGGTGVYALVAINTDLFGVFKQSGSDWLCMGVYPALSTDTDYNLSINHRRSNAVDSIDDVSVANLRGNWSTAYGIATDRLAGDISAGTSFTHAADFVLCFDLDTANSAGLIQCRFRIQDTNNYWRVVTNGSGDLVLQEVIGGVTNSRSIAGGVIGGGEFIQIRAIDEIIEVWYDNTKAFTWNSAANFKTETAGELNNLGTGGAVSDLITFPRTLLSADAAILEAL